MKFGPGVVLVTFADGSSKFFEVQQFVINPADPPLASLTVHRDDLSRLRPDWTQIGGVTLEEATRLELATAEEDAFRAARPVERAPKTAQWKREITRWGSGRR